MGFWALMNRAAMNIFVHVFCAYVCVSDGYKSRSENVTSIYALLPGLLTVF